MAACIVKRAPTQSSRNDALNSGTYYNAEGAEEVWTKTQARSEIDASFLNFAWIGRGRLWKRRRAQTIPALEPMVRDFFLRFGGPYQTADRLAESRSRKSVRRRRLGLRFRDKRSRPDNGIGSPKRRPAPTTSVAFPRIAARKPCGLRSPRSAAANSRLVMSWTGRSSDFARASAIAASNTRWKHFNSSESYPPIFMYSPVFVKSPIDCDRNIPRFMADPTSPCPHEPTTPLRRAGSQRACEKWPTSWLRCASP